MVVRAIVAIHVVSGHESEGSCIVQLHCGHRRHVRDRPPMESHPWVRSAQGRTGRVGQSIECGRCDACERPVGVQRYREGPVWDHGTIPAGLRAVHRLRAGVWAELVVIEGRVRLRYHAPIDRQVEVDAGGSAAIPPEIPHELELLGPVRVRIDLYR